jgi:hypothetical protein
MPTDFAQSKIGQILLLISYTLEGPVVFILLIALLLLLVMTESLQLQQMVFLGLKEVHLLLRALFMQQARIHQVVNLLLLEILEKLLFLQTELLGLKLSQLPRLVHQP